MYSLTFDGKLFICPAGKKNKLHRVLDVGTGTGIWAIDFADEHPETRVIGVDLSPIQPLFIPPNLTFEVDDLEEPWTFSEKFDFIYMRMMTGSLTDYPRFFEQCFANLSPGGFFEVSDIAFPIMADDGTIVKESALYKWSELMQEAAQKFGRPLTSAHSYKEQLIAAGFEDVVEIKYKWPSNRWPKDKKYKELGMWCTENVTEGLSGLSMALYTRALRWSQEETEAFLVEVRKNLRDTKIHSYWPLYVVYGRKPLEAAP